MAATSKTPRRTTRPSPPGSGPVDCERRMWLRDEQASPEGEYLLCTDCGDGRTTGCVCHTVCRTCGNDDLIQVGPVSWFEAEAGDAEPL